MPSADGHRSFKSLSSRRLRPKGVCVVAHSDAKNGTAIFIPSREVAKEYSQRAQAWVLKWELTQAPNGAKEKPRQETPKGDQVLVLSGAAGVSW